MNPTSLHNSTSLAQFILRNEGHSCTLKALLSFFICVLFFTSTFAQDTTIIFQKIEPHENHIDSIHLSKKDFANLRNNLPDISSPLGKDRMGPNRRRIKIIAATNIAGYGAALVALNSTWYKNYPRSGFHAFNDIPEWKGMDKIGHAYGVYAESLASMELWRWTGVSRKKRIWYGGLSGPVYHTVIEVLDGFSSQWGWSWGDIGANFIGSGMVIAQELAWDEQRIQFKFSFHRKSYSDPTLNQRSNKIFGSSTAERFLKDYNGQTYWLSTNIHSFFPESRWPKWLNIAVGTGAEGMFGANDNIGKDDAGTVNFNRPDIKRYRQWYLSPDIDLTKIKTNKKGLKLAFRLLNIVKIPMPALEFSNGSFKVRAIGF
jgi:uncharacterized protein YfiM (DUF2279 family)